MTSKSLWLRQPLKWNYHPSLSGGHFPVPMTNNGDEEHVGKI